VMRSGHVEGLAVLAECEGLRAGAGIDIAKNGLDGRSVVGGGQPQGGRISGRIADQLARAARIDILETTQVMLVHAHLQLVRAYLGVEDVLDPQAEDIEQEEAATKQP